MRPGASESGLHFICDAKPACSTDMLVSMSQIAVGKNDTATNSLDRFRNEAGNLSWRRVINQVLYVSCVVLPGVRIV